MDVYKTIKRSVSATATGIMGGPSRFSNSNSTENSSNHNPHSWIHPPDTLINGRVEYTVKMLGYIEVQKAKGSNIVRDAIHAIRFQLQIKRGETGHSGAKLGKVLLQVSISGVNVMDFKTRAILFKHPLNCISFCADDKQDKRVFSYIAKNDSGKNECFVFLSDKMAESITLTIGEAFDLAYERFLKKGKNLENQKQILLLKKNIVQLEEKNRLLEIRLKQCHCASSDNNSELLIPIAPILQDNKQFPTNGLDAKKEKTSTPPLPLAPPPRRTSISNTNNILTEIFQRDDMNVTKPYQRNSNGIFDDDFDPRASEKVEAVSTQPKEQINYNTVEEFEALLHRVDMQLAEVQNGLESWKLDTGDTGQDWSPDEDEQKDDDKSCRKEEN